MKPVLAWFGAAAVALAPFATPAFAADADAAKELMKTNQCNKCHAPDKDRSGPSLKKIAAKYKGKADAEQSVIKSMTTGIKVKLDDGTQEEHKVIKTKDAKQLSNLAQWILAQ